MMTSLATLLLYLSLAHPGDTVKVDGTINATGHTITVPEGITLFSDSRALIYSTSKTPVTGGDPLIKTGGPNVTLSGLRLRGATGEITDFDYRPGVSKGVHGNHPNLTIVNCEIYWFDMWGVYLYRPEGAIINNNYIHNCRNAGYGYGVWVGGSGTKYEGTAIITNNIFDACRSAVDGSGHYGNMVVNNNTFLPEQHYTVISRHGQSNGCIGGNSFTAKNNIVASDQRAFTVPDPATDSGKVDVVGNRIRNSYKSLVGCNKPDTTSLPWNNISTAATITTKVNVPVTIIGSGSETYWWRFGDGLIDQGQRQGKSATYTYKQPGVYIITCIGWTGLDPIITYYPVAVLPDSGIWISLSVKDSYVGSLKQKFVKNVYINNSLVWSDDVAGYEGWQRILIQCDTINTLSIELVSPAGCKQSEIQELFCWWDAISVVSPNKVIFNESFENKVNWTIKTYPIGAGVSTQTPVGERRDGERSYLFRYAYGKDVLSGWGCSLTRKIK